MDDVDNRMLTPRRRGPPSKLETTTPLPVRVEVVEIPQPPLRGIRCPSCGRAMVPQHDKTTGGKVYATCRLCGASMVLTYDGAKPVTARLVR